MSSEAPYFAEGSLPRRMASFSAPLVAANLLQYLYQFVDMAIVGHFLGETALVSVSNASSVAFVISSVVIGLTAGGGAVVARRAGAADIPGQRRAFAALLAVARMRFPGARSLCRSLHGSRRDSFEVLRLGVPGAVQQAVINVSYVIVTAVLNSYGADVAAAAGVGLKASTLAGLPCWAVGQAVTTAAAQCAGAGKPGRAAASLRVGLALAVAVTLAMQVLVQIFAPQLVAALGAQTPVVVDTAVLYLRITCSVNGIFYAAMYAFDSFALAVGAPKVVLANSLADAFVGRVGLAVLLGAAGFGYIGVFVAQAASPVLPSAVGALYALHWARRRVSDRRR